MLERPDRTHGFAGMVVHANGQPARYERVGFVGEVLLT